MELKGSTTFFTFSAIPSLSELTGHRFLNSLVGVRAEYCPSVISSSSMGAPSSRNMNRYTMMNTTPPYFSVRIGNSHRLCAPGRKI